MRPPVRILVGMFWKNLRQDAAGAEDRLIGLRRKVNMFNVQAHG